MTLARRLFLTYLAVSVVLVAVAGGLLYDTVGDEPRELLFALGVALAVALGAAALSSRRLIRPIRELRRIAGRVAAGDLEARGRIATGDELEDLARDLDAARMRLADRIAVATAERDRLEGVLEAMVEGVVVVDATGRVALANGALVRLFGIAGPVAGHTPLEALRHPEAVDGLAEAAASRVSVARDVRVHWPVERVLALHAVGLTAGGAVGVFHDVTERRRLDAVRRDFVANVSHELRTPLATMAGHAEELADPALDIEQARRSGRVIRRHVDRMTALVEDLLVLARLEANGFTPRRERVDVGELLEELSREWRLRAAEASTMIIVHAEEPVVFDADPLLLRQALSNLIDNALKYGRPDMEVRLSAQASAEGVELAVADQGPGIPHEDQPRIFERFYRVDKGRSRERGGTGLGLAIVRHVAEVHGGRASVESRPGAGATFRILIPTSGGVRAGTSGRPPRALS